MDNNEFSNSTFQRVYQYLRRHDDGQKLDRFQYQDNVEGTHADCLKHFLKLVFIKVQVKIKYAIIACY